MTLQTKSGILLNSLHWKISDTAIVFVKHIATRT